MRLPKKGEEVFYIMPNRVCIAEWDGSPSLIEAFQRGYIFKSKSKAKKFCREILKFYEENVARRK